MRICIPIRESNLKKAQKQVGKALVKLKERKDSLVEIWFDDFDSLQDLLRLDCFAEARKDIAVIAVCRAAAEKGSFKGSEQERINVLKMAIEAGSQLVDVSMDTELPLIKGLKTVCDNHGAKLIISKHFWDSMPDLGILEAIYDKAESMGADIVKIAVFIDKWEQNADLFELCKRLNNRQTKFIVIGMGKKGKISRIGCPLLGSYLTYVALDAKSKTADGQMTFAEISQL